jgi:hypothetical protein
MQTQIESVPKQIFFQLSKYDDFRGIATGVAAAEELDHDGEILDYQGSKPYFQQWSDSQFAASKGQSKGNVRLQHDAKRCVGKLSDIQFDDAAKKVRVVAQIVDPVAKDLLRTGCLTGFSIGGDYISRSPMPNGVVKYIAGPAEISVCDRPCAPSATYESVKADGTTYLRKFSPRIEVAQSVGARIRVMKAAGYPTGMICAGLGITAGEVQRATRAGFGLQGSAHQSA